MSLAQNPPQEQVSTPPGVPVPCLDAALDYAAKGWPVMPLHDVTQGSCSCGNPACSKDAGKHPHLSDWTHTASTDPAQIRRWWAQWSQANVGIATGARSGLAVLDVDPRNGGDLALEDLVQAYGPLPDTPLVLTGGQGQHHYFAHAGALGKFNPGPGLNLQADGALVVVPPSLHISGRCYAWEASSHPNEVPLAPLPDWLKALGEAKVRAPLDGVELPETLPTTAVHTLNVSARLKYLIVTGQDPDDPQRYPSRSEALFAVIQGLLSAGYDEATIAGVVLDRRHGISAKPWSQKNPKSPHYEAQTRAWVAQEIGRATAKHAAPQHRRTPPVPDMTGAASDPVDTWLGPRSTWFGVPRAQREVRA